MWERVEAPLTASGHCGTTRGGCEAQLDCKAASISILFVEELAILLYTKDNLNRRTETRRTDIRTTRHKEGRRRGGEEKEEKEEEEEPSESSTRSSPKLSLLVSTRGFS